ncbi:hypothetical protein [Nocardia brevicatena]|uniref:hypothetical protein n=1 Tax=Nocardia brevicatena TaxID=37327 RepID=UPI0003168B88|nr:hypothetical protein [Nocardia brevicatena]
MAPVDHTGHITRHPRTVPGACPWVGVRVVGDTHTVCSCGKPPYITTRQLRIVLRKGNFPFGPVRDLRCPGSLHCLDYAPVDVHGMIGDNARDIPLQCPWVGVRVHNRGLPPALLDPETAVGYVVADNPDYAQWVGRQIKARATALGYRLATTVTAHPGDPLDKLSKALPRLEATAVIVPDLAHLEPGNRWPGVRIITTNPETIVEPWAEL